MLHCILQFPSLPYLSGGKRCVTAQDQSSTPVQDTDKAKRDTIRCLRDTLKHQGAEIRQLKEKMADSTKRIRQLTGGLNTTISVAFDAASELQKFVCENFIPEAPDVDGREINRLLAHLDTQAEELLHSAIQADETLTGIQDGPWSYEPNPAEDDSDLEPYDYEDKDDPYKRDRASFLWEEFGISSEDDVC